jgi:hypothetical protein
LLEGIRLLEGYSLRTGDGKYSHSFNLARPFDAALNPKPEGEDS